MIAYNARMHTQGDSMGRLVRRDVNLAPNSLLALSSTAVRTPVAAVVTETAAAALPGAAAAQTDTDDYPTRMAKYVPAEVVAFYLAADKLFTKGAGAAATGLNLAEAFVQKDQRRLGRVALEPFVGEGMAPCVHRCHAPIL